ncbi:PBSX family phage terminase large subunit [Chryseobacterium nematophagum]|uniref:PBSX family phage terminase large subunit n=1 Tax=Chryseobacterium nematophagum TaxID=2305228 RepID=A0A3M7LAB6_9FLAO|nr:PBSX family phage terminase large subunit [Chryseobacterium nematophagum]RMZ58975.1 PBSX family phage terminase large subunit [Chryseobacterium nematophagum]
MLISHPFSHLYKPVFETHARYIPLWGGRGRGGSYTATALFLFWLNNLPYFRGYLMREILGDVRDSLFQDMKDRIEEAGIPENFYRINEHEMAIKHPYNGNYIHAKGFKKASSKQRAKLKSLAGATHIIIEEADEISEEDFNQLDESLRTIKGDIKIILLFNPPPKDHWVLRRWFDLVDSDVEGYYQAVPKNSPEVLSIFSTYYDNLANITQSTINLYENYKENNAHRYYTSIAGLISEGVKGRVFGNWQRIPQQDYVNLPYLEILGLDFGFNDPIALVGRKLHKSELFAHEYLYEVGLTNKDLVERLVSLGISKRTLIIADSANPKDIEDLRKNYGYNVQPAYKGKDSILNGIKKIKEYATYITSTSDNFWYEYQHYCYALDQYGKPTDSPVDKNNHCIDPLRYSIHEKPRKSYSVY